VSSATWAVAIAGGLAALGLAMGTIRHPSLLILVAVGIAVLAWQQLGAELNRAYGDLRLASLFSGGQSGGPISNLLFLAGLGVAALLAARIDAPMVVGIVVASLVVTCPLVYFGLWHTSRSQRPANENAALLSSQQHRQLLAVGGMLLANQLLAFATQQFDIWLAGGLLTTESLGLYGAAKRSLLITAMPVQMAMLAIVPVIPRLHARGRAADLERVVRGATTAAAIPALIGLAALTLFPREILGVTLGDSYSGASSTLLVMAAGHYVLVLSGNPQHVLTMTGRHRAVLAVNLASAIILAVAGTIGALAFGAPGLAAGSAASLALQNGVLWWLARRELGIWTHIGVWNRPRLDDDEKSDAVEPLPHEQPPPPQLLPAPESIPLSAACPR
jgi:O-antigen/teichoic acid export membrane protein